MSPYMNKNNCYHALRKVYSQIKRPLRIACDWDEVMYLTEQECLRRLFRQQGKEKFSREIVERSDASEDSLDPSIYPHGVYWQVCAEAGLRELGNRIFFEPDVFHQPNRVLDTYDGLVLAMREGIIESLLFMTYSPITKLGVDYRKKALFNNNFRDQFPGVSLGMVIIPYRVKGIPYEKGQILGTSFPEADILIDNHLGFIEWGLVYSKTPFYLVPRYNQEVSPSLAQLIGLSRSTLYFYEIGLSKLIERYE